MEARTNIPLVISLLLQTIINTDDCPRAARTESPNVNAYVRNYFFETAYYGPEKIWYLRFTSTPLFFYL